MRVEVSGYAFHVHPPSVAVTLRILDQVCEKKLSDAGLLWECEDEGKVKRRKKNGKTKTRTLLYSN